MKHRVARISHILFPNYSKMIYFLGKIYDLFIQSPEDAFIAHISVLSDTTW